MSARHYRNERRVCYDVGGESQGDMVIYGKRASMRQLRTFLYPDALLLTLSVAVPLVLFGLAAWQGYRTSLDDARTRVDGTARVLQEHAGKVFETHRLVITAVNQRLRTIDWSDERQVESLHDLMGRLQDELPQVATVSVVDAQGRLEASSRTYPIARGEGLDFSDRDWFRSVRREDPAGPWHAYVSKAYEGRQSLSSVFNVAGRAINGRPGTFSGVVAVSVDRKYFKDFYDTVEPSVDHSVTLVREDGLVLARDRDAGLPVMPAGSPLMLAMRAAPNGSFRARSVLDGVDRLVSYRKVDGYPVYVAFGISAESALAPWHDDLVTYGIVAVSVALALVLVSGLALHRAKGERLATERWREAAAQLQAEATLRQGAEEQLRQSQKMEAVGRLTGGIAHDFNNVLTIVLGSLDILKGRLGGAEPRVTRHVDNAIEGATRAAELTARLLAFSRRQPMDPRAIEPNDMVSGMLKLVGRTLGEQWKVETERVTGAWSATADANQLESALLNLAVNARDAMPGGGRIRILVANVVVAGDAVPGLAAGEYVAFEVVDEGTGMDPDTLARAFDPFFTTKEIGKGTGLGLSQVYGFARQSGGTAAITTTAGRGTAVRVYLPRTTSTDVGGDARDASPVRRSGEPVRGETTVLVVEDDAVVRSMAVAALRDAGYDVHEASEAREGLDVLRRHPEVALLFTDMVLGPGMGGRELADQAAAIVPGLAVIFTTGYPRDAILAGGDVIHKPYVTTTLLSRVRDVVGTSGPDDGGRKVA